MIDKKIISLYYVYQNIETTEYESSVLHPLPASICSHSREMISMRGGM